MQILQQLYRSNLALLTDLYQLTMAQGYWKSGMRDHEAAFHLFFRKAPFKGGFTIAAGLEYVIDYLRDFHFEADDVAFLAQQTGSDGKPLFEQDFLDYLQGMRFTCDVEAVPEGSVVFPQEPLLRITGSLIEAQLIETPLLNIINFQSLIATKAARVCMVAGDEPVLEFGLRRAQGIDGGLAASRAAYLGGCAATSNVLAGKLFGIPVKGTHAHSWVMSFDSEAEAFTRYAEAMPNNCIFLVDTYDTLEGVREAIKVGQQMRTRGHEMAGIRLDSGDLAYLSIEARKLLDDAGFGDTKIVASNDLDEYLINSLHQQDAKINVWGIGTKLTTAYDQPALGGVYKISAIRPPKGDWKPKIKLSEQAIKISNPGLQRIRRFYDEDGLAVADMIYEESMPPDEKNLIIDPKDMTRRKKIKKKMRSVDLLTPIFARGQCVYDLPTLHQSRQRVKDELQTFHRSIRRLTNPHEYPVGLERQLFDLRTRLILEQRAHHED
ncbi:MAG: nicotinate phosphoribosyltransferase [Bernardetiaceae bacterium]